MSEQEFADFFDNASISMHWVGPDGRILRANRAELELLGYSSDEYVGRHIAEFHVDRDVIDDLLKRLHAGETLHDAPARMRAKDGSIRDVLINSSVMWRDGEFLHTRCITRDVTAHKRATDRLRMQYSVTTALSQTRSLDEIGKTVLGAMSLQLGWDVGGIWYVDTRHDVLRCEQIWHRDSLDIAVFEGMCRGKTFARGEGLPGRVWESAAPVWGYAVETDPQFRRAAVARKAGLRSALGFPLRARGDVIGVLEFFSTARHAPDEELLQMLGNIGAQVGQFIDRKRVEDGLRESERRFRLMTETVPSMIWTADASGRVTYANERWRDYTGVSTDAEGMGTGLVAHPDEIGNALVAWRRAIRDGTPYESEGRIRRHDGVFRWFVTRALPLRDESGEIVQWIGTSTDIDDRKRTEQVFHFLADASASLAELTDKKTTLERVASLSVPAFADWCAIDMVADDGSIERLAVAHADPEKVKWGWELGRRYPPDPREETGVMGVIRKGKPEWLADIPEQMVRAAARDADHLRIILELGLRSYIAVPLTSRGRTLGAITFIATAESGRRYNETDVRVAQDLAHRAVIAIENATLLETLRESDRKKDEFLAMLAHELRNPLAPIRNAAHLLEAVAPADGEMRWATEVIDRQVRQMTRLVDDLLDVSRITRGKIELRLAPVDLNNVVRTATESARPLIEKRQQEFIVDLPDHPVMLEADEARLAQVILNLLDNASKYTPEAGRVELHVSQSNDQVCIRVRDNGIGIPPHMLGQIFEMFTQVDHSLERAQGGLGIGLTLVRRLVEMHGGTVAARSGGTNAGSEFVITLPALPSA